MAELRDVIVHFCSQYPHKHELSNARLTKMVYLADWRSAITRGRQITSVEWVFKHFGPYVEDIRRLADSEPEFEVVKTRNPFGQAKELITVRAGTESPSLTDEERNVLDFVISTTSPMHWDDFIKLVYSTYPIVTRPRYSTLDLVALAKEYDSTKHLFEPRNRPLQSSGSES
jgi:hypothetical protein